MTVSEEYVPHSAFSLNRIVFGVNKYYLFIPLIFCVLFIQLSITMSSCEGSRFTFIPGLGDLFCTHFIAIIGICFFGLSFPSGVFYWFWRFSLIRLLILIVIVIKIINSSLFYCKIPRPSYADFEWRLDPFSLFIRLSILLYRWLLCYLCTLRTLP